MITTHRNSSIRWAILSATVMIAASTAVADDHSADNQGPPFTAPGTAGLLKTASAVKQQPDGRAVYRNTYTKLGLSSEAMYSGQPPRLESEAFQGKWQIKYRYDATVNPYSPLPVTIEVQSLGNPKQPNQMYKLLRVVPQQGGSYEDEHGNRVTIRFEYFRL